MSFFGTRPRLQRYASYRDNQKGLSVLELAIYAALLSGVLVAATDYSLAILARQEVHAAARAGLEFAINRGYDESGVKSTVMQSRGPNVTTLRFATINPSDVSSTPRCACYVTTTTGVTLTAATSATPRNCSGICPLPPGVTSGVSVQSGLYVTVNVRGTYSPLVPFYWFNLDANRKVPIQASYTGKAYFSR